MKLLICTQTVDLDDPVLGFFHRWLAALAKRCETVHVVCLKKGKHELPANVFVHSLGKESGRSRVKYVLNLYRYIFSLWREYDAVFVHMNEEYVLLGGWLWRIWGKRVVLWRNHKTGSQRTRVAAKLVDAICYTSPEAFVAKFGNAVKMPVGIDTEFFSSSAVLPKPRSILFLGRLDPVKRVDVFVKALEVLHQQGVEFTADIVGDPTEAKSNYAHDVRNLASGLALEGILAMHPAVTNDAACDLFRSHAVYCNLTPSGSFDKTILEAASCGTLVVAQNAALRDELPRDLMVASDTPEAVAYSLRTALDMGPSERRTLAERSRSYVVRDHSLALLARELISILQ